MRIPILVVASDVALRAHLARLLSSAGYRVDLAESAEHVCRIGLKDHALALVAAAGLGPAGDALVAELQATTETLLIARSLDAPGPPARGALDPSDGDALLARVADALRPAPEAETALTLHFEERSLDLAGHSLTGTDGHEIPLTRGEFRLLREFVQRPGRVLSRDHLLRALSGREAEEYDRSIDMLVVRLRRKIESDSKRPTLIATVPGAGYKFTAVVRKTIVGVAPEITPMIGTLESHEKRGCGGEGRLLFPQAAAFRFGDFRLDHRAGLSRLHESGQWQPIVLGPRTLEVLIALVERHGELVTKQALTEAAWHEIEVEPDSLTVHIAALRRILDVGRAEGSCIQTVAGRGYRFVLAVTTQAANASVANFSTVLRSDSRPRLSVVVLPFKGLSNDPSRDHHAEAIFDNFAADLSRFPGAFVITGSSAGIHATGAGDARRAGMELGVNYAIQGSVRRTADHISVNLQLTDVQTGGHLWAERLGIDHADAAGARDEVIGRLVRAVSMKLIADLNSRIEAQPMRDWTPYDLVMRGRALALRPLSARNRHDALRCYQQALDMDPCSVWAKLGICLMLIGNLVDGGSLWVERDEARAEQLLLDVLRTDADIPEVHTYMGMLRRYQGRLDDSRTELEIAIGLVPNNILATSQLGLTLAYLGQPDTAIPLLEWCLRLAPHDPNTPPSYSRLGLCHLLLSHVEEAIVCLRNARAVNPQLHYVHQLLAAALALQGDLDEAGSALRRSIEIRPDIGSQAALDEVLRQGSPRFLELYRRTVYAGLLRAGLAEVAPNFVPLPDEQACSSCYRGSESRRSRTVSARFASSMAQQDKKGSKRR